MPAQRTVACPACRHPRVTKSTGRQRLACSACGNSWLVRDSLLPEGVAPATGEPSGGSPPPSEKAPVPSTIGGVEVLEPVKLKIGGLTLPSSPPASEPTSPGEADAAPGPTVTPSESSAPEETLRPAPVSTAPGRKVGYYRKVTGGG